MAAIPCRSTRLPLPIPMSKTKYPKFYENAIPIALAALGLLVIVLLVVIAVVLLSA